jgi:nucleoside diphosphate kinase
LTGEILSHLELEDVLLVGARAVQVDRDLAAFHYYEHKDKPFYESVIDYLRGQYHRLPWVYAFAFYGENVCQRIRDVVGNTNPMEKGKATKVITLRQKYGKNVIIKDEQGMDIIEERRALVRFENVIHASFNDKAEYEVKLWFEPEELLEAYRLYPYKSVEYKNDKGNPIQKLVWEKGNEILRLEVF